MKSKEDYRTIKIGKTSYCYNLPWKRLWSSLGHFYFGIDKSIDIKGLMWYHVGVHILIPRSEYQKMDKEERWGYHETWYDGPINSFGFGRLFFIYWM